MRKSGAHAAREGGVRESLTRQIVDRKPQKPPNKRRRYRLLQCAYGQQRDCVRWGGRLHAGTHAVRGQVIRRDTR